MIARARIFVAVLACVIAASCTAEPATVVSPVSPTTSPAIAVASGLGANFRADLRVFAGSMPKTHLNLFHSTSRTAWRSAIAALDAKIDRLTPAHFEVELLRLVALTHDGHTQLQAPYAGTPLVPAFHEFPIALYSYSDGVFVQQAAPSLARLAGARLVAIDGMPIADAAIRVTPLIDRDSDAMLGWYQARYLVIAEIDEDVGVSRAVDHARFTFEIAGLTEVVELDAQPIDSHAGWTDARAAARAPAPPYLRDPSNAYWAMRIGDEAVYVQWNVVLNKAGSEESIFGFFTRVLQEIDARPVQRLIIDVRFNQGGERNNVDPVVQMIAARPAVDRPGALFVITGRRTFSSGVVFCALMERSTHVTFVGEPASSRPNQYATIARITLPNTGLVIGASTQWNEDDPGGERPWIAPQVAVSLSSRDYARNVDPAMAAILGTRP